MIRAFSVFFSFIAVLFLVAPLLALLIASSPDALLSAARSETFVDAVRVSLLSTLVSVVCIVLFTTPLAFWIARRQTPTAHALEVLVQLPIVMPPSVVGLALLMAFGSHGLFAPLFSSMGVNIAFTPCAVVIAQFVVAAPFFLRSAASAFRGVDRELELVAQSLGSSPKSTFFRITLPLAAPGLAAGFSLCWARALGEFGATLLFAGNLPGVTQSMPVAILSAFESNLSIALALSLLLSACGAVLLILIQRFTKESRNRIITTKGSE